MKLLAYIVLRSFEVFMTAVAALLGCFSQVTQGAMHLALIDPLHDWLDSWAVHRQLGAATPDTDADTTSDTTRPARD